MLSTARSLHALVSSRFVHLGCKEQLSLPHSQAVVGRANTSAGSISSVGDALDNALTESAVGLYKSELIDQHPPFTGRAELERGTAVWVHRYNTARRSSLDHQPPTEFETALPSTSHRKPGGLNTSLHHFQNGSPCVEGALPWRSAVAVPADTPTSA
jgi:hypothetical protein